MKYFIPATAAMMITSVVSMAQGTQQHDDLMLYSILINRIPAGRNVPSIGFINYHAGSHSTAQAGFINHTEGSMKGAQAGFLNSIGSNMTGAQVGFLNSTKGSMTSAAQVGFVDVCVDSATRSAQVGFVNITASTMNHSTQVGFTNIARSAKHITQVGFTNVVGGQESDAVQVGMVNVVATTAAQVGFANATKVLKGTQVGFFNYTDSVVGNAIPVGFLSIARHGGYYALDISMTDMAAAMLSFKVGMERFYTSLSVGYNPRLSKNYLYSVGFGTILNICERRHFTFELANGSTFRSGNSHVVLSALYGYRFGRLSVEGGIGIAYQYESSGIPEYEHNIHNKPFAALYRDIDSANRIIVGLRVGLRWQFSPELL